MFGNTRFMAAVIVPLVATPSVVLAQDTPITGARFTLVEKTEAALSVTLENLRDSPLVAWEIGIRWADSKTPGMVHFSDRTASRPYSAGNGPIEPRSRRVVEIPTGETLPSTAVMRLAIFGDGHYEGQPEALQAFLRRQREEAEDLRYWIAAFNELPRVTSDDALTFLRRRLAQRAADRSEGAEPSSITAGVRSLLAGARPPELHWLISTVTRLRAEAEQRMTRLVLPATPIRLNRDADVVSVRISSEPAVHHRLFGIVENLRDVPIEALGLDQFGADGRVQSA